MCRFSSATVDYCVVNLVFIVDDVQAQKQKQAARKEVLASIKKVLFIDRAPVFCSKFCGTICEIP